MKYNFDIPVDRRNTDSLKYDGAESVFGKKDIIPLWVADMDFPTAQPVIDAMAKRNEHGIFGYTSRPASYFEAVRDWQKKRNGWTFDTALASFCPGVVPALAAVISEFTRKGDAVLFFTPVYPQFFNATKNCDRIPLTVPLMQKEGGSIDIDFDTFEKALQKKPALFILCHPHNPLGRVWKRSELEKIDALCRRYKVPVVSDEIHSDIMLWGNKHIPLASIGREAALNTITCTSATKTFNLAGLQASTIIFPDAASKQKFDTFWQRIDIGLNNCFSVVAVEAAFREGEEWLEQLLHYIEANATFVKNYFDTKIPEIKTYIPQSTYLMWLDCRALGMTADEFCDFMVNEAGLGLSDGRAFGSKDGYMRINVACPRCTLEKALSQLEKAVAKRRNKK
ncbi:MAG: MalY/PatB family protein [Treponema lecithinolyticum]|uniref:MalY/PatB family protein n=1 Tax=Treponema lecithinolyticum TaxID=53418 RepID=UPI003FA22F7E